MAAAAAAPPAGDSNPPPPEPQNTDLFLIPHQSPNNPPPADFTISQLIRSNNDSNPNPSLLPPLSPLTSYLGKRKKSKPVRYGDFDDVVEKPTPLSERNAEGQDSSSKSLSSPKGSSATKNAKPKPPALVKAEEIQSNLGPEHPNYSKMVRGQSDTGYWMGFPQWFGKLNLPKTDSEMEIEDENGEIYSVKYIADKCALSAGWKKFAVGHNLLEGDAIVFSLIESHKFKVYIVRANDLKDADDVIARLNSEAHTVLMIPETNTPSPETKRGKRSVTMVRKKHKSLTPASQIIGNIEPSGNNSEELGSEVLEGFRPSEPDLPLQDLESFKDFHITVKGVCIDSELPEDVRMSYFRLCMDRKELLHDNLPDNLYHKLVAGMIGETVNIANKIKNCKLTTTKEEFGVWDNSLKSFASLGMKVGFLTDKIAKLSKLVSEFGSRSDVETYVEAKKEHERVEGEIKRFEDELKKLKEASRKTRDIVNGLKKKVKRFEVKFEEEVNVPW
ncbi:B3 domain-containing protein Os01g0234100-like [Bidens hawaiensis]|uniref:B3 domain-containing protein Os01g0234100-like n=1 Tax=Bidens hawaiensis TaxID=980011 RepID=UPI004049790D